MENEEGSNFLQRVITGDELWIYKYDPETKRQSEEWKHGRSPRSKKVHKSFKNQDHAHCFFFIYIRGVVHHEFVPQGQTVNAPFYVDVLKCLCERV
jgi:hypothetical protein